MVCSLNSNDHFTYFGSNQVVLLVPFDLLVGSLTKAQWRFASMECGDLCVITTGMTMMPGSSAGC